MRLILIILGSLLLSVPSVSAEDFRAEASVDRRAVGLGEMLTLTVTVYGADHAEPDLSTIEGFRIAGSSSSRSISIVNMKMSRSLSLQYTLIALEEGEYVLGPFTVRAGDETYDTEPINVAVVKGQAPSQRSPSRTPAQQPDDEDLVMLTASVDTKRAYVGEQITYTLKFAYRVRLLDDTQYIPPEHTGFWYEDLGQSGPAIETIDGVRYYVITKRTAFFPISSGKFTIGKAGVRYVTGGLDPFSRDPFSLFGRDRFGAFGRRQGVAESKPVDVEVLPLPTVGKPRDFSGGVGTFSFSVQPSATEVRVGESLTLSLRIRGRGNLKSIGDISLPEIKDFRVFAPKARESLDADGGLVGGEKVFELVLVPQSPGEYTLDGFQFSYFDPGSDSYATDATDPLLITVLPGDESYASAQVGGRTGRSVARREVRHIRRGTVSDNELTLDLVGSHGILIRYLPILVVLGGVVIGLQRRRSAVSGRSRARRALKAFSKQIGLAESVLAGNQTADAAASLSRAIKAYLAARCGVPESVVDGAFISSVTELTAERREALGSLISELDRIRFAPVAVDAEHVGHLIEQGRDLIRCLDKEWTQ
jgi:hypothetical protein